jgi:D-xylose transport system ATP-binding protein
MHLFGAWGERRSGRVELGGRELRDRKPEHILRDGIALVSEDRRRFGLVLDETVGFNLSLSSVGSVTKGALVNQHQEYVSHDQMFHRCA